MCICPAWQQQKDLLHLLHLCGEVMQLMEGVWYLRSRRVKPLHPAFKQALGSSSPCVAKPACTAQVQLPKCSQEGIGHPDFQLV